MEGKLGALMPRVDMDRERFDRASLLRLLDDDLTLMAELLHLAADMKDRIGDLGVSIRVNDMQSMKANAHKLKGAALGLTFNRLAGLAKRLEESSGTDCDKLMEIHREMMAEWAELESLIKAELR